MKITGKIERVDGGSSENKRPRIFCPQYRQPLNLTGNCDRGCCPHVGKTFIDWDKGICAVDCKFEGGK